MIKYYVRECNENGIPSGRKIYEMKKLCNCSGCNLRFKYLRQAKNCVTVKTSDFDKLQEMETFLDNWKCKNGKMHLETEYYTF